MAEDATESRWFRIAFGRPRLRNGVLLLVPAVCLLAFTVSTGGNDWSYLIAAVWGLFEWSHAHDRVWSIGAAAAAQLRLPARPWMNRPMRPSDEQ